MRPRNVQIIAFVLIVIMVLPLVASLRSCGGAPHEKPPIFANVSLPQALAEAGGKIVLVKVGASWCPPCREMDRTTWRDPLVIAWVADHGRAIEVDADQDGEQLEGMHIRGYPTMMVFKDGKEIARAMGYMSAPDLLEWLKSAAG